MIFSTFTCNREKLVLRMEIEGHAEVNPDKRLICCAASTIAYNLAQVVTDYHKTKQLAVKPTIKDKKGHMIVEFHPKKKFYGLLKLHLVHAKRGLDMLHINYPDDVAETEYIDASFS